MSLETEFAEAVDLELMAVARELKGANAAHPPMNSLHESYAVILEELDELWDHVRLKQSERNPALIRKELIQIAAMAIRTIVDGKL